MDKYRNQKSDPDSKQKNIKSDVKSKDEEVKKSKSREFVDALIYAGVVAFIIKILFFEAFRIPTGSMEKTLMVGDFLLVTKFTYGATSPRNIPFTDIRLPYFQLPGFKDPKKGDIIVFDFPGDRDDLESKEVVNYIKRCVATPGDTLQIIDKKLYVNGQIFPNPPNSQFDNVKRPQNFVNPRMFPKGSSWNEDWYGPIRVPKKGDKMKLDSSNYEGWKMFVMKEGHSIKMTSDRKVLVDDKELPNGEYTVERDYLFMMGDNRNNSLDSRFWGFMPVDNIVGEALMIYWSWDPSISFLNFFDLIATTRWERIGTMIK
ncbi:MAG TPA: signal peptidase I [Ignavibacteria bacterium]|nr:signal peptidase I [Ignavibacteria bacterium]